ncbi:hypothetical protein [Candidatus Villigracilis affinis]|uniref:hypothetical protein n=1 Tax=Candidatus Villigracilis affinis TaxID=3140682 RepID=UPI002A21DCFB|nr:hypothetical protein [Anaerolineales bacterium]
MFWFPFAWLYLCEFAIESRGREALKLGTFWAVVCILIDLVGWILISHPWAMTFKEFYMDYQPWITLIYLVIFFSPIVMGKWKNTN